MAKYRICNNCGKRNEIGERRCKECGELLDIDCEIVDLSDEELEEQVLPIEEDVAEEKQVNNTDKIECPFCKTLNDASELVCSNCNMPLKVKKETEEEKEQKLISDIVPSEGISLIYNNEEINLSNKEFYYIGRRNTAFDAMKINNRVSGLHCVIFNINGKFFIQDVSTNGTKLNGQPLNRGELYSINEGDSITIDTFVIKVKVL